MSGSDLFKDARGLRQLPPVHGPEGEVTDLRNDVKKALAPLACVTVEEFTNPVAASTNGVRAATAASLAVQSGSLTVTLPYPRLLSVTTAGGTPTDAPASVTITGTDVDGKVISETISVPQTATTANGTKAFKSVTGFAFTAGQGTDATVALGWAAPLGLSEAPKVRAGAAIPTLEVVNGARVTTGTLSDAATNPPYGVYTPASAPNATSDYAVYFECVPRG